MADFVIQDFEYQQGIRGTRPVHPIRLRSDMEIRVRGLVKGLVDVTVSGVFIKTCEPSRRMFVADPGAYVKHAESSKETKHKDFDDPEGLLIGFGFDAEGGFSQSARRKVYKLLLDHIPLEMRGYEVGGNTSRTYFSAKLDQQISSGLAEHRAGRILTVLLNIANARRLRQQRLKEQADVVRGFIGPREATESGILRGNQCLDLERQNFADKEREFREIAQAQHEAEVLRQQAAQEHQERLRIQQEMRVQAHRENQEQLRVEAQTRRELAAEEEVQRQQGAREHQERLRIQQEMRAQTNRENQKQSRVEAQTLKELAAKEARTNQPSLRSAGDKKVGKGKSATRAGPKKSVSKPAGRGNTKSVKSDAKVYATTAEDRAARGAARSAGVNAEVVTGDSQREEDVNEEDSNQASKNKPMEVAPRANTNLSGELGDDNNTGSNGAVSSRRQCGEGGTSESGARREV